MARFRLVAMDLDGTLLDSRRSVPEANRRALERARRRGVALALVTGRRLSAARHQLSNLSRDLLDHFLIVVNGGALVRRGLGGPILKQTLLPVEVSRRVIALAAEIGVVPIVHEGPDAPEGELVMEEAAPVRPSLRRYLDKAAPPPRQVLDLGAALVHDPLHIFVVSTVREMREAEQAFRQRLGSELELARTEYPKTDLGILDLVAPGASKADALRFLAAREGIPADQVMAIGDNWNDLAMLEAAGLGVVMANAAPELRSRGFAITGSNDECGVASALDRYVLSED